MEIHTTIESTRAALRESRKSGMRVGFVPTMGALHDGHLALIRRARVENDVVVISIFVNPLQFGPNEDLPRYPRPFENDCRVAQESGVDLVFAPSVNEMYPEGRVLTQVAVSKLTETMEGLHRPGHFNGVTTVVAKLFNIIGECRAYFGEKDWQQLTVVRRMVADPAFPTEIIPCPIERDFDGLALSSRNVYLQPEERRAALSIHRALQAGAASIESGCVVPSEVSDVMLGVMRKEPSVEPQYASVVDANLETPEIIVEEVRLLVAARVGSTHLIDNMGVRGPRRSGE